MISYVKMVRGMHLYTFIGIFFYLNSPINWFCPLLFSLVYSPLLLPSFSFPLLPTSLLPLPPPPVFSSSLLSYPFVPTPLPALALYFSPLPAGSMLIPGSALNSQANEDLRNFEYHMWYWSSWFGSSLNWNLRVTENAHSRKLKNALLNIYWSFHRNKFILSSSQKNLNSLRSGGDSPRDTHFACLSGNHHLLC